MDQHNQLDQYLEPKHLDLEHNKHQEDYLGKNPQHLSGLEIPPLQQEDYLEQNQQEQDCLEHQTLLNLLEDCLELAQLVLGKLLEDYLVNLNQHLEDYLELLNQQEHLERLNKLHLVNLLKEEDYLEQHKLNQQLEDSLEQNQLGLDFLDQLK